MKITEDFWGIRSGEFRIGDKVILKSVGGQYSSYRHFFAENGLPSSLLAKYEGINSFYDKVYTIISIGKHRVSKEYIYVLREEGKGRIHLMSNSEKEMVLFK